MTRLRSTIRGVAEVRRLRDREIDELLKELRERRDQEMATGDVAEARRFQKLIRACEAELATRRRAGTV